jgi:lipoprotein-anchoring transpeptidase ErfK/SrfK
MAVEQQMITVSIGEQRLRLVQDDRVLLEFTVSTALNGPGEQKESGCTPRGMHYIRARIGVGCQENSVFVGRRATGEIYSELLAGQYPQRDWILSRILWLSGLEPGRNRLGNVDTMQRYIYIHGTPDSEPMGIPVSHGCIRMRNQDIIQLFDEVTVGTRVLIEE